MPTDSPLQRPTRCLQLATFFLLISLGAHAQNLTNAQRDAAEQRRIQERDAQLRDQQERGRDVRTDAQSPSALRLPAQESPCFPVRQIELSGKDAGAFSWVLDQLSGSAKDDSPLRKCIGAQGVGILQQRAQEALVARGFVTSRILVQPQDLSTGNLVFTVLPGTLHGVQSDAGIPPRTLRSALPMREGDILNLRDIEQALENFQRAPTAQADIQIAPASTPDQSDLLIRQQSSFPLRASFSFDDSGSKSTGKYQGSATLSWDNPLGLNDLLYISQGNDAQGGDPGPRGNQSNTLHYSLPWGYWAFGLTASDSSYYQTVTGSTSGYIYSGGSGSTELKASRVVYRDATSKDTAYLKATERHARNYINGTEVLVQRRASALWELGLERKVFLGQGTLQANVAYKRGTRDFEAIDAPEESSNTGTARPTFYTADLSWNTPWTPWALPLGYQANLRLQATDVALASPDRFNLGGRYTIRGFDGESTLSGDAGWLLRQDLQWNLGASAGQLYVAVDMGEVDGPSANGLSDRFMAGTALGWRIQYKKLQFDAFVGHPLRTPSTVRTPPSTAGFSLNYAL
ncbi:ShlB/FhaC/HecB family hemolysin secretion/activation protein [Rhodoferax sp.]|uniref:ShlB/FhaC/HecB family hemolysin secretion/activation protein n=1 Tax=Rhodoferax sp. TaxID=50421 RepID=UPI0025FB7913|nr:ShlB/FhaC/HecB family hemolysin secretion/activation protein [Rhodoferax sp.]